MVLRLGNIRYLLLCLATVLCVFGLYAQNDTPADLWLNDPSDPLYIIDSWSDEAHESLAFLIQTLALEDQNSGFPDSVGVLNIWKQQYYSEAILRYELLSPAVLSLLEQDNNSGGNPLLSVRDQEEILDFFRGQFVRNSSRSGRDVLIRLSSARWEQESLERYFPHLLNLIPLLRPDITPAIRYWHSLFPPYSSGLPGADGAEEEEDQLLSRLPLFFRLAAASSASALRELLIDSSLGGPELSSVVSDVYSDRDFSPLMSDPVSEIYRGTSASLIHLADDALLSYNRFLRDGLDNYLLTNPDDFWPGVIGNVLDSARETIFDSLPALASRDELRERLFISENQFSDEYWLLLSLLEIPFFIEDPDRTAQLEALYLELVSNQFSAMPLRESSAGTWVLSSVERDRVSAPRFSLRPQNLNRLYTLVQTRNEDEFITLWSETTRGTSEIPEGDAWHIISGLIPVKRDVTQDFLDAQEWLNQLDLMVQAAIYVEDFRTRFNQSDPFVPYLISLRQLFINRDIGFLLRSFGHRFSNPRIQAWLNLNEELVDRALALNAIDLPGAMNEINRLAGISNPVEEVFEQIQEYLSLVRDEGAGR